MKIILSEDQGEYIADVTREYGYRFRRNFDKPGDAYEFVKGFSIYAKQKGYKFDFVNKLQTKEGEHEETKTLD